MNICGCLIHVTKARADEAESAIAAFDGVEVHATDGERFVVVVEDSTNRKASETIMALHQVPGVVSLTLTYHHFEEPSRMRPTTGRQKTTGGPIHDHI